MQRILIASGAAVVVTAAIAGYLILGTEEAAPPPVADAGTAAPAASEAAPPAPPAPAEVKAEAPAKAPAEAQPVITVKKRETLPSQTAAVTAPLPEPAAPAPAVTAPAVVAPSFDVVRVERSGETVIAGRAQPDSEVTVKDQTGEALGKARADSSGAWALVTEAPLTPGSHEIGIEAESGEGAPQLSEDLVVVVVPEVASGPDKTEPAPPAESQVLAVLTPRQGSAATRVLPQEPEDGIAQGDLVLDSVDYDDSGRIIVGGRASSGTRMLIYLDNKLVGDTRAGAEGRWSHSPVDPVSEGLHSLRVDQVDEGGKVLARVETPFSREAVRIAENDEDFVIVQPGNSLWRIARRTYGEGIRYSVIYQANKGQIRNPDLIYPGQVFELPKTN